MVLRALDPDAEIRFTLDGSTPGPANGTHYAGAILITNTTRLRAVALANGLASRISGESYIKLAPNLVNYTSSLPIMVIENFAAGTIPQKGWNGNGGQHQTSPAPDCGLDHIRPGWRGEHTDQLPANV